MAYYLRIGDDPLDVAARYTHKRDAVYTYKVLAENLSRYGQELNATIHIADKRSECVEYPDFYLSLGPRGGVRCERA